MEDWRLLDVYISPNCFCCSHKWTHKQINKQVGKQTNKQTEKKARFMYKIFYRLYNHQGYEMKWTKFSFSNTYHMGRWRCYMCLVFVCNMNALLLLMTAKANKIYIHDVTGINDSHNEMHLFSLSVLVSHVWSMLKILHGVHTAIFYGMVLSYFVFITSNCWSIMSCLKRKVREKEILELQTLFLINVSSNWSVGIIIANR